MADKMITVVDSRGGKREVNDTAENRQIAKDNGFTVEQGTLDKVVDFAKGAYEGSVIGRGISELTESAEEERKRYAGEVPDKSYPDHAGKITVVDSKGGRREVSDNEENRALAEQHGFNIESADETKANDILNRPEYQGARGAGHVFQKKLESELGFGLLEEAQKARFDKAQNIAWEKLKDDNKAASYIGSGLGIVGNLFLTEGMGLNAQAARAATLAERGMTKLGIEGTSLLGKAGVSAAKEAARGVTYAAPHAVGQAVFDSPSHAAEGALASGMLTAVVGGMNPFANKFINYIKPAAEHGIESAANLRLMKNLGMSKATENKLGGDAEIQKIASVLYDAGIANKPYKSREALLEAVDKLGETSGAKIGKFIEDFDRAVVETPELAAHGFNPGNVIKNLAEDVKRGSMYESDMRQFIKAGRQIVRDATGAEVKLKGTLDQKLDQLVAHAETLPNVSFETAQKLKKTFQPNFKKNPLSLSDRDLLERRIYGEVTGELNAAADRVAESLGDTAISQEYALARKQYRAVMATQEMRQNLVAKQDGNRFFSPSDYGVAHLSQQLGLGHAAHAGGSALGGGVLGMVGGYVAKRALESTPVQTGITAGLQAGAKALRAITAEHIAAGVDRVGDALVKLGSRGTQSVFANASNPNRKKNEPSPIATIIGSNEKDGAKALEEFQKKIVPILTDPKKKEEYLGSVVKTIHESGDPEMALNYATAQLNAWDYLHKNMPKTVVNPAMFTNAEYKPSRDEIKRFEEICATAQDPFYVVRKIEDGSIDSEHVDTLKVIYPQITGLIKQRIESMGYENQIKNDKKLVLPSSVRQSLARLSDAVKDDAMSPEAVRQLQEGYKQAQTNSGGSSGGNSAKRIAQTTMTSMERIATK